MFSAWWPVPFLLALSGAPGLQSFFSFSSAQISLSLSLSAFSCSSLSPLEFTGWGLCLSWLLSWLGLSLAISWWPTYWYPCISFRFSSGRSFPPSWWGPALLLRWTSFQSVLLVIRGISCSSWLSPLHSARFWFIVFSVPCGWVGALLPSVRLAPGLSLSLWPVGCSPVSSVTVPSCVLSWSLGFSIPWQFPRPGLLFPGSRILQLPPPWYCGGIWILPSAPLGCFILLLFLFLGLLFLFLATAFPTVQLVPRFSLFLSDLVFCSSQSCLGLQWFWSSCPFRCWGSRLPLPIAVFRISSRGLGSFLFPDFVPGWLVLRLLRWCSAVSSCFPAFSRLADPCSFYSPALFLEALLFMFSSFSPLVL